MTITTPNGAKIRTTRHTRYAVVVEVFDTRHPYKVPVRAFIAAGTSNLATARTKIRRLGRGETYLATRVVRTIYDLTTGQEVDW